MSATTTDQYEAWARRWADGMRASEPFRDARRIAQSQRAVAARAAGRDRPCGIEGCERHSYKGRLCRQHYAMVPDGDKVRLIVACFTAQIETAERHHRRFLRDLRARLAAEAKSAPPAEHEQGHR